MTEHKHDPVLCAFLAERVCGWEKECLQWCRAGLEMGYWDDYFRPDTDLDHMAIVEAALAEKRWLSAYQHDMLFAAGTYGAITAPAHVRAKVAKEVVESMEARAAVNPS